jgi:hypothetical protein
VVVEVEFVEEVVDGLVVELVEVAVSFWVFCHTPFVLVEVVVEQVPRKKME